MPRRPLAWPLGPRAGTWAASRRGVVMRRPPSQRIEAFTRLDVVPVGNDGIAAPATFTAGGTAKASVGPSGTGASWSLDQASVYTSVGALDAAQVSLFVGPQPIAQYQVAASLAGGGSQLALGGISLDPGWFVWAVWSGGTAGALAYLYVTGERTVLVP